MACRSSSTTTSRSRSTSAPTGCTSVARTAIWPARARLPGRLLGASCYNQPELAHRAIAAGADYVAFGSVFPSATKPRAVRAPLSLFALALGVPKVAIGGITLENAREVVAAGADCVAVITDLFEAPDVAQRAREFAKIFQPENAHRP